MKQIFINLPVHDVEKSMQFYLALGFTLNPLFSDNQQKCVIWSDAIYLMIQTKQFSNSYLNKTIIDPKKSLSISLTIPVESKHMVNDIVEKGLQAGGIEPVSALEEEFMFLRSIEDLDGYLLGIMYLDIEKFKALKNIDKTRS